LARRPSQLNERNEHLSCHQRPARLRGGLITRPRPEWCEIAASFNYWRKSMLSKRAHDRYNSRKSALEWTFLPDRVPAIDPFSLVDIGANRCRLN
jgi:hypothetical protein